MAPTSREVHCEPITGLGWPAMNVANGLGNLTKTIPTESVTPALCFDTRLFLSCLTDAEIPGCGEILLAIPNTAGYAAPNTPNTPGYDAPLSIIRSRDQRLVFALSGVTSICHGLSQSRPVASGCEGILYY